MKNFKKLILVILIIATSAFCSNLLYQVLDNKNQQPNSIVSITKTNSSGLVDTYTILFTNGETSTFTITNGKNGTDGNDFDIYKIYENYVKEYGEITYKEFLAEYLTVNQSADNVKIINECLQSCMKVYTEFLEKSDNFYGSTTDTSIYTGSAVIYKMYSDYTYIITNYHVTYNVNSVEESKISKKIHGYLYGSESHPTEKEEKENGYTAYEYGDYAIPLTYIGGSITNDIVILQANTNDILKINSNAKPIKLAQDYYVGQTAIAIGNPEDEGLSVTQGIVSVDNENISLAIDNTTRYYRSIRIDTAIYTGSSGGGLFNQNGELIGITNAGDTEDQNVNYAIPLNTVIGVADNILYYCINNNETQPQKITLGITVSGKNTKYVYNQELGYGKILEDIQITEITNLSTASLIQLQKDDLLKSFYINDVEYTLDRYFRLSDYLLKVRPNDVIKFKVIRNGLETMSEAYTIQISDLVDIE